MTSTDGATPTPDRRETSPAGRLAVVGVLQALAVSPSVVILALLAGDDGAAPVVLAVLSTVFVGPAVSAGLFALGEKARDDGLGPAAAYWRGYRLNVRDVLMLWVPTLMLLAVLAFTIVDAVGTAPAWAIGLGIGAAALILLWLLQCTVIASFFAFRVRDTARLGLYFLGRLPRMTLLVLTLIVAACLVAWLTAPAVLALLGVLWTALLLRVVKPMLAEVRLRFVHGA